MSQDINTGVKLTKPPALQRGDKVATITLSWGGAGAFPYRYEVGKKCLEDTYGITVVETTHARRRPEWIAANPQARANDLMEAFSDQSIKAIISIIGGTDSNKLIPFIDYNVIRANPKIFMGFSDSTIVHYMCLKAGLGSFYGPSIMAGFAENSRLLTYTQDSVSRTLFNTKHIGEILPNQEGWTSHHLPWEQPENQNIPRHMFHTHPRLAWPQNKIVTGHLVGGCVEALERVKQSDLWPNDHVWDGAILFLETSEVGTPVENFRKWITDYADRGILQRVNGIILGRPGDKILITDNQMTVNNETLPLSKTVPERHLTRYDRALYEVVHKACGLSHIPILTQMDFGHSAPVFVIPYGQKAEINCARKSFTLSGSGVSQPKI